MTLKSKHFKSISIEYIMSSKYEQGVYTIRLPVEHHCSYNFLPRHSLVRCTYLHRGAIFLDHRVGTSIGRRRRCKWNKVRDLGVIVDSKLSFLANMNWRSRSLSINQSINQSINNF